jgi:signal transduction histidine kinase/PAS domain-containing protein
VQEKLLTLFHFSLNQGGYLFLGGAEGVGAHEDLFTPIAKSSRIFRRLERARRLVLGLAAQAAPEKGTRVPAKAAPDPTVATLADREMLQHLAATGVAVTPSGQIVRFYGAMNRYIAVPPGDATLDILTLARPPLKAPLRAVLHDAIRRNRRTVIETPGPGRARGRARLRLSVRPLAVPSMADKLWLIVFEDLPLMSAQTTAREARGKPPDLVRQLERELRQTRKEQQHLVEQLESSNEELNAANEEVLSMNEELQSTNEELVTSKEELQSMNEELTTLNAQLQEKVEEVTATNDDLANLLVSTDIATVFVDKDFRVKRFTTAATHLLNLLPDDRGRPIHHLTTNLVGIDLAAEAHAVLTTLTSIEKEVAARDGRQYIIRVIPYRTQEGHVHGVVLTLVDVTALKTTQQALMAAKEVVSGDLHRMTSLHALSSELAGPADLPALLNKVIRTAVRVTGADMGHIHVLDEMGTLTIAAHDGLEQPFLDAFARIQPSADSAWGTALATRRRVIIEDVTTTSPAFRESPSMAVLLAAGVRALQSTPLLDLVAEPIGVFSTHYRTPHRVEDLDGHWLDLLARQAELVIERMRTEALLGKAREELEDRVRDRTKWLALMHAVTRAIHEAPTWDEALQLVLRRMCESGEWQIGYVYLPLTDDPNTIALAISGNGDERFRAFHDLSAHQRYARDDRLVGRVYARGTPCWANTEGHLLEMLPVRAELARQAGLRTAVAFPVSILGEVIAVLELFSTQVHEPSEELTALVTDVSDQIGRVIERERTTVQMSDLVWREQQELLHTLHDSLGQTLTGLGMLSMALSARLTGSDAAGVEMTQQIARQAQAALEQVRLLSRGLFPVAVDAGSLVPAIHELAATTESLHKVHVQVQVQEGAPIAAEDARTATQLYRIVQKPSPTP